MRVPQLRAPSSPGRFLSLTLGFCVAGRDKARRGKRGIALSVEREGFGGIRWGWGWVWRGGVIGGVDGLSRWVVLDFCFWGVSAVILLCALFCWRC